MKERQTKGDKLCGQTPRICGEANDRARFGTSNNGRKIKSPTMRSTDGVARFYPIFLEKKRRAYAKKKKKKIWLCLQPNRPLTIFSPFSETARLCRPLSTISLFLSFSPLFRDAFFFPFFSPWIFQWQTIARLLRHCCKEPARHQSLSSPPGWPAIISA